MADDSQGIQILFLGSPVPTPRSREEATRLWNDSSNRLRSDRVALVDQGDRSWKRAARLVGPSPVLDCDQPYSVRITIT